ncbi:hypothetical protein MSMTP_2482 [Methanosarcina sp. MTP4]|uniref:hypothetical protein n=1 Tax=Methanosarcina sp. MTP4 TaxID=1434100 RepID=UPI0006160558|nr:hypothetical protein [Methanosarcina sp. MTP4]AKB25951.1 hypothetical protein MSMTP_2482 [Methanosarcina sp. MTP4]
MIRISDNASQPQIQEVLKTVVGVGGRIEMVAGRIIIASFDSAYAGAIKKKKGVALVGGVNFRGRKIRKITKRVSREEQPDS